MKCVRRVLPLVLLSSLSALSTLAPAHDAHGTTAMTSVGATSSRQYNPWRPAPRHWGSLQKQHSAAVQQQPAYTPKYVVPMHPLHARQYEYQNYLQQVNPYYANSGVPWWADPVAVPYGPWAIGNGWPNGLW